MVGFQVTSVSNLNSSCFELEYGLGSDKSFSPIIWSPKVALSDEKYFETFDVLTVQ